MCITGTMENKTFTDQNQTLNVIRVDILHTKQASSALIQRTHSK